MVLADLWEKSGMLKAGGTERDQAVDNLSDKGSNRKRNKHLLSEIDKNGFDG